MQVDISLNPRVEYSARGFNSSKVQCFQAIGFKCQPAPHYMMVLAMLTATAAQVHALSDGASGVGRTGGASCRRQLDPVLKALEFQIIEST